MVYGELEIIPLNLSIQNGTLNFWARVFNGKPDKRSVLFKKQTNKQKNFS